MMGISPSLEASKFEQNACPVEPLGLVHQRVGRLVVTEYRYPCLRDIGQVLRTVVNDVRS